jgi:DNA topoisomerase IA
MAMGKALIIAEKPSVANDIAKALGGFTKKDDYFESDQYVLASAIGHLLELAVPEEYQVKRGKWKFENLPIIPPQFDLQPIEKTQARLKLRPSKCTSFPSFRSVTSPTAIVKSAFFNSGIKSSIQR